MAEAFGIACHELVSVDFRYGSKADVGEARSITNQAGHYGYTPMVVVRRFQPLHRDRWNSVMRGSSDAGKPRRSDWLGGRERGWLRR